MTYSLAILGLSYTCNATIAIRTAVIEQWNNCLYMLETMEQLFWKDSLNNVKIETIFIPSL